MAKFFINVSLFILLTNLSSTAEAVSLRDCFSKVSQLATQFLRPVDIPYPVIDRGISILEPLTKMDERPAQSGIFFEDLIYLHPFRRTSNNFWVEVRVLTPERSLYRPYIAIMRFEVMNDFRYSKYLGQCIRNNEPLQYGLTKLLEIFSEDLENGKRELNRFAIYSNIMTALHDRQLQSQLIELSKPTFE